MRFLIGALIIGGMSATLLYSSDIHLQAGVKAGLGLSTFWGENKNSIDAQSTDESRFRKGLIAGVLASAQYKKNKIIALQLEVNYAAKGKLFYDPQSKTNLTIALDYLEIPFFLKLYLPKLNECKPFLMIGPSFGFNLNAKNISGLGSESKIDDINSFDIGAAVSGGVEYPLFQGALFVDIRFTPGLNTIDNAKNGTLNNLSFKYNEQLIVKNSTIGFSVGYCFKF